MNNKKLKKICFVVTTPFTVNGFLIRHLTELAKIHQVTLCINLQIYELSPKLDTSKLQIIDVPLERKISLFKDLKAWWVLWKIFRQNRFHSVHSITPKAGLIGMSAAFFAGVPRRLHTFTGQIWVTRHGINRIIFKGFDWLIAQFASLIFADSNSQRQFLIQEKVCKSNKISLLGYGSISGVDLERFTPNDKLRRQLRKELLVAEDVCVFLFVGRLCRDKGIFDLVSAFVDLRANHQNTALWIVGPDEENIQRQIQEHSLEIYHLVTWIGPSFSPENYMAAADVLVLPSYREGFGSVIIEAAACNLPTIAYRIDGVIDAVVDRETGSLVEAGDITGLIQEMRKFCDDSKMRASLAAAARSRACEKFSNLSITQAWLSFYEKLLSTTYP